MKGVLARICAAVVFAVPATALPAEENLQPSDFVAQFPLADVKDGLTALELTEPVYRAAARRSLQDLRVFNADGEALPMAMLPAVPAPAPDVRSVELAFAPLPAENDARSAALQAYAVRLERDRERALLEIRTRESAAPSAGAIGGYLIDARPLKDRRGRVVLAFAPNAADYAARVELLGSDDLVSWRALASGPLAHERRLGDVIEKSRFDVHAPPPFLRVAWSGTAAPQIGAVRFEEPTPAAATLPRTRLAISVGSDPRSLYVDVPPALPVERLFIRMPQANVSERLTVYRHVEDPPPRARRLGLLPRRAPEQWVRAGALDAFRVTRDGAEVEGPPLAFTATTDRLRIDAPRPFAGALPTVEAEWRPARIVFAARAPGPYRLAAGRDNAPAAPALDLRALLPKDDASGQTLPTARIVPFGAGEAPAAGVEQRRAERIAARANWSRGLLWAVLGAAVLGLAWMAWRLAGQLRGGGASKPADAPR